MYARMCVLVRALPTMILNLEHLQVAVYREATLDFGGCCQLTRQWLPAFKAEKDGLIQKPLMGAAFNSVARCL